MNKYKLLLGFILVVSFSFQSSAQLKKANSQFRYFKYSKAIPLYEKVLRSGDAEERAIATQRLADCYRLINDVENTSIWYQKATELEDTDSLNYWYLGQALRNLEKYDEAGQAFKQYMNLAPNDLKGEMYYRFCVDIQKWENLPETAEIINLESINTRFSEFSPSIYKTGIVFTSDRQPDELDQKIYGWTNFNYLRLYFVAPEYPGNYWRSLKAPEIMEGNFNGSFHNGPACFSNDSKMVYVTKTISGDAKKDASNIKTNLLKIFYSKMENGKVEKFYPFPYNNKEYSVGHAALSPNNQLLVFSSDMPGGLGGSDLYICRYIDGIWDEPKNIGSEINSIGDEVFPYFLNDSTLYFSSDGHLGFGGLDIFVSQKGKTNWSTPENLKKPINSSYDDFGIVFTKGDKTGLFSSNRPEGKGYDDIYAFRELMPASASAEVVNSQPEKNLEISGKVKDWATRNPLPEATVFLLNTQTDKVQILKSDKEGNYNAPAENDVIYIAKALKPGYIENCTSFRTPEENDQPMFNVPEDLLLGMLEADMVFKVENIYYDLDKWDIRPDAKPALDNLVSILNKYAIKVELSSHTDSRASYEYNMDLSQKRAQAAVNYLVSQGVDPSKLIAKGYGESRLVNRCADGVTCTEEEHQQNRRTEFKILSVDKKQATVLDSELSIFKEGDIIDLSLLKKGFFSNCLGDEILGEPTAFDKFSSSFEKIKEKPAIKEKETTEVVQKEEAKPAVKKAAEVPDAFSEKILSPDNWYAVQISANKFPKEIAPYNFQGEEGIYVVKEEMFYRIFKGKFQTLEEAEKERERLDKKFHGAYIVTFTNGVPSRMK